MKRAILTMFGKNYKIRIKKEAYSNNTTAVVAKEMNGQPFCVLSVNLPESISLPEGAFYAKHWSENTGFVEQLIEQRIIEPVNVPAASSGFVDDIRAYRLI